jgi:hypothetical protein
VVSFFLVSPRKASMSSSSLPFVLYSVPMSSSLTWSL